MKRLVVLLDQMCVVEAGHRCEVPDGGKRLLAFVALAGGRVDRRQAAGELWPDGGDGRAAGNLRSALWRLRGAGIEVFDSGRSSLCLAEDVDVDVDLLQRWASRIVDGTATHDDLVLPAIPPDALDLLPGWYDEWVIFARERVRQRFLHALDRLAVALSGAQRHADAVDVALTAVAADPLRESAHRALIIAHLGEGNLMEARRAVTLCRDTFARELGVEPSAAVYALLEAPPTPAERSGRSPVCAQAS